MTYTRRPLGTIIHAVALITSAIAAAYGLRRVYDRIVLLSLESPTNSSHSLELETILIIFAVLIGIFLATVSFLCLFTPNIIIPVYKSKYRSFLFAIHTIFSVHLLLPAIVLIIAPCILSMSEVLWVIGALFLPATTASMWEGVDSMLFPWKITTPAKPEELTGQMV